MHSRTIVSQAVLDVHLDSVSLSDVRHTNQKPPPFITFIQLASIVGRRMELLTASATPS